MGDIHQLTLRHTPTRQGPLPETAEVIIFPGVRFERVDACSADEAGACRAGKQAIVQRAVWTDD